jgi:hypothetical protein
VIEGLRAYAQLAAGLTEFARDRALAALRSALSPPDAEEAASAGQDSVQQVAAEAETARRSAEALEVRVSLLEERLARGGKRAATHGGSQRAAAPEPGKRAAARDVRKRAAPRSTGRRGSTPERDAS